MTATSNERSYGLLIFVSMLSLKPSRFCNDRSTLMIRTPYSLATSRDMGQTKLSSISRQTLSLLSSVSNNGATNLLQKN